jgi:hypothetical protein
MDKILKDPLRVRAKQHGKSPWNFKAPTKDQAHSGNISAGDDYGVGHRTPVGKERAGSYESGPIPMKAKCFSPNEIFDHEDQKG